MVKVNYNYKTLKFYWQYFWQNLIIKWVFKIKYISLETLRPIIRINVYL